jgi:hypothetical protein
MFFPCLTQQNLLLGGSNDSGHEEMNVNFKFPKSFKKIGALSHAAIGWKKNHNVCYFGSGARSPSRFTLCTWPTGWTDLATAFEVSVSQKKKAQNLLPILKSLKKKT